MNSIIVPNIEIIQANHVPCSVHDGRHNIYMEFGVIKKKTLCLVHVNKTLDPLMKEFEAHIIPGDRGDTIKTDSRAELVAWLKSRV